MLQALNKELVLRKDSLTEPVETIYFGGGTPSVLSVDEVSSLLKTIYRYYDVIKDPEITLEANPDDLTGQKIKELSGTAVNRLSIGTQSFFDEDLQFMNRIHTAEDSVRSVKTATEYFKNITIDLIYGVPGMSVKKWQKNLETAFDLGVQHISAYALTVEDRTALAAFIRKGKVKPLDEDLARKHFETLVSETADHGYVQYEISNFGKEGFFSKHNTAYWQGGDYLGIGPSAHSFFGNKRSWNVANNARYLKAIQKNTIPQETEFLSEKDRFNEMVMTGLRTIWGVSLYDIGLKFGGEYRSELIDNAEKHLKEELLKIENDHLLLSKKALFLADGIASDLFKV